MRVGGAGRTYEAEPQLLIAELEHARALADWRGSLSG
jgi:hypothetical protein